MNGIQAPNVSEHQWIERESVLAAIDKAFKLYVEHDDILRLYSDVRSCVIYAPACDGGIEQMEG